MINLKRASHASFLLLGFFVVKSMLALLVKSSLAHFFGAGMDSDAYFAAFSIPQQLGDFMIGGILFRVIIPVFQKQKEEVGEDQAGKDIAGILNLAGASLVLITAVYYLAIPFLIPVLFPGYNPGTLQLTISLSRWLSPAIILMGLTLIYIAFYHAHRSFLVPALANLFFPLSSLLSLWLLPEDWGINRLVYGNLAGVTLGLLLLFVFINRRIRWRWEWRLDNPVIRHTLLLAWPLLVANLTIKLIPIVQKNVASQFPSGTVSLLEYANFLAISALVFVATPIATVIFPLMGEQQAKGDDKLVVDTFFQTVRTMLFIILPMVIMMAMLSTEITAFIFQYGSFTDADVNICANLLLIIVLMILPQSLILVMNNLFLVYQKTRVISLFISVLVLISLPLYFILARYFAVYGIPLARTIICLISCLLHFLLLYRCNRKILHLPGLKLLSAFIIAGLLMVGSIYGIKKFISPLIPSIFIQLVLACGISGGIYLLVTSLFGIGELRFILERTPFLNNLLFGPSDDPA